MEQAKQIAMTVIRVFVGTVLAAFIADATNLAEMDWSDWKPVIIAAIAAAAVVVLNALNPRDARYGVGSKRDQ